jgi:hypothetical protein
MFVWALFWIKTARIRFLNFLSDIKTKFFAAHEIAWHYIFFLNLVVFFTK